LQNNVTSRVEVECLNNPLYSLCFRNRSKLYQFNYFS